MKNLLIECWLSGQIEPDEMVKLCREDHELETAIKLRTKEAANGDSS